MRSFKFALVAAVVIGLSSGMAHAQLRLTQKGVFTPEDAYSQMGGIAFQLAPLNSGASRTLAQMAKAN